MRAVLCTLVALALALFTSSAWAQQVAGAQREAARERFARGVERLRADDYAGAVSEFEKAYQLAPYAVIRFNLGLAYAKLQQPLEASKVLEQVIADPGNLSATRIEQAKRLLAEQSKRIGQLEIDVSEAGASVRVDGLELGRTPLAKTTRVAAGVHFVEAVKHGFAPVRREARVEALATERVRLVLDPTEQAMAQLWIRSPLRDAEIWLDGARIGKTPLNKSVPVLAGRHTVEVRRKGYRSANEAVDVGPGATAELDLSPRVDEAALADDGGFLVLDAEWANELLVSVDGVRRGRYVSPLQLPAGMHEVRIERGGFFPATLRVAISPRGTRTQKVVLEPTAETIAEHEDRVTTFERWAWGTIIPGSALLVAGVAFTAWSEVRYRDLSSELEAEQQRGGRCFNGDGSLAANLKDYCQPLDDDRISTGRLRPIGWVLLGVGGALTITGVSLFIAGPDRHELDTEVEGFESARLAPILEAGPDGGFLGVSGRF